MLVIVFFLAFSLAAKVQIRNQNSYVQQSPQPYENSEHLPDDGTFVIRLDQLTSEYYTQIPKEIHFHNGCGDVGDMKPNESDNTSYYECVNGQYKLRLCPAGNYFDPMLRCCRTVYGCANQAVEPSTALPPSCNYGELRADDTNCQNYYICVGNNRHFERRICPDGKTFDKQLNRCVYGSGGNVCKQQLSKTTYESRNVGVGLACIESSDSSGYNADPTDCRHYYQCAQGRWVRMRCPDNLVWNPTATVCDWPRNTLLSCQ